MAGRRERRPSIPNSAKIVNTDPSKDPDTTVWTVTSTSFRAIDDRVHTRADIILDEKSMIWTNDDATFATSETVNHASTLESLCLFSIPFLELCIIICLNSSPAPLMLCLVDIVQWVSQIDFLFVSASKKNWCSTSIYLNYDIIPWKFVNLAQNEFAYL